MKSIPRTVRAALVPLLALAALPACQSTWYSARFQPAPLEVSLGVDGVPEAQGRALLTVLGIQRAADGHPAQVVLKLRLDDLGSTPLALVPDGFDCVTSDLVSLDPPSLDQPPGEPLQPGESRVWTAAFAVPAGRTPEDLDWRGLNVKWTVAFGDRKVTTGVTFDRVFDPYYDGPRTHVSVGMGMVVGG